MIMMMQREPGVLISRILPLFNTDTAHSSVVESKYFPIITGCVRTCEGLSLVILSSSWVNMSNT